VNVRKKLVEKKGGKKKISMIRIVYLLGKVGVTL